MKEQKKSSHNKSFIEVEFNDGKTTSTVSMDKSDVLLPFLIRIGHYLKFNTDSMDDVWDATSYSGLSDTYSKGLAYRIIRRRARKYIKGKSTRSKMYNVLSKYTTLDNLEMCELLEDLDVIKAQIIGGSIQGSKFVKI